jgi:hypothetical protein
MAQIQKLQQEIAGGGNANELLSVTEAQTLGVPYGTTKGQAANMQITPGQNAGQSVYQQEQNKRIIETVDSLLGKVSNTTVGVGSLTRSIPGSPAANFAAELDTLKSNIAFGQLTAMREASKTGGALGQVSDVEERLLQSALGALSTNQSPAQFKVQLQKVKDSLARWDSALHTSGGSSGASGFGSSSDPLGLFSERGGGALAIVNQKFPDGTIGGQCGTFAHKIADFPPVGNYLSEKQAVVNNSGLSAAAWRQQGPRPGDVVISNLGEFGHVEVVLAVKPGGQLVTKASNLHLDEKVATRTISINDNKIYGVLRGTLKVA